MQAGRHQALVDVLLAPRAPEAGVRAVAGVGVHPVRAHAGVLARRARAVVNVLLAVLANISGLAKTVVALQK